MTSAADIDALASEYVLGTLDAAERAEIAGRLERDPQMRAAVQEWERRLGPLADLSVPVTPPPGLEAAITRRIALGGAAAATAMPASKPADGSNVVAMDLQRSIRRWRRVALTASALAASLAVVLGVREFARPTNDQNFVAVFQKDDASPAFVMSVDLSTRTLSVRRVAADVPAGKTYQLWIKSDTLGPDPQSLGLVQGQTTQVTQPLAKLDAGVVQNALFGVSLEPAGGSPKPTGPVFHAKLIPTGP